jgi:dethiobiotin synthetase
LTQSNHTRRGLFVTGTDTGVGKTIVTATLVHALTTQGMKAGVMKPIETGMPANGLGDSDWLISVTGTRHQPDLITPYRFKTAAAPLVAALAEGVTIDPTRIVSALEELSSRYDCLIVEGIGGVLVPVTGDLLVVDLIRLMGLPALIVARAGLGSINHSLLSVEALRARGIPILGFVFNNSLPPQTDTDMHRTIPTILQLTGLPSYGELPYREGLPDAWNEHRDSLMAAIDVDGLLEVMGLRGIT